jgi:hypothetical protein
MKKVIYVFLLVAAMLFAIPLSSYAPLAHAGTIVTVDHRGFRGFHGGWHGHHGFWGPRFFWGGSIVVGPPWYPDYYQAPPVVIQQDPPTYVQPQLPQENYWYYCQNPQGYYPYVSSCPGGWMKVVPQAPPK